MKKTTNEEEFKKSLELTIYDSLEVGRYILHYVTMFSVSKDVINQLLSKFLKKCFRKADLKNYFCSPENADNRSHGY